ncbi:ATP-binding protein [Streptomyces tremellae]|uniref:ATP-binding protein n=1 Tax=Streptomyces tremellae TaxID=1124239 RepID=A0ABP7FFU9_9ACTN
MTYATGNDGQWTAHAPGLPTGAAEARHRVHDLLVAEGVAAEGRPFDAVLTDSLLLTSELVTNALYHGGGLTGFSASVADGCLVLVVSDASTRVPAARAPRDDYPAGGYGWPLVCRIAGTPEVVVTASGKTVRAVMPLRRVL